MSIIPNARRSAIANHARISSTAIVGAALAVGPTILALASIAVGGPLAPQDDGALMVMIGP